MNILVGAKLTFPLQKIVDETTTNITYIGEAEPGTAVTEARWRITKVDETVTGMTTVFFPENNARGKIDDGFRFIWEDREDLEYRAS